MVEMADIFRRYGPQYRAKYANRLMRGPADKRWLGLYGMRERAELLGGTLTLESAPGVGTTVFVKVPLHREREGHGE